MKFCINCDREIQEDWTMCPYCAVRIKFTTKKKPIFPNMTPAKWIMVILVVIIGVLTIVLFRSF